KKKKRKKKKGGTSGSPPLDTGPNYACGALEESCGNAPFCQCRLNTNNQKVCTNVVNSPNGAGFSPCLSQADCPAGTYCDQARNECLSACVN
ncbi:MAG: hypothetical protein KC442_09580, partial [Thermomicrobiales bacterium]|nr:hypothetical protein [Thermomicrobiales bacterium]